MMAFPEASPGSVSSDDREHELYVERDGRAVAILPIREGEEISVGRGLDCTIALDDDLVSRKHAVLRLTGAEVRVEDMSTNGTLAAGVLLRRQAGHVGFDHPVLIGHSSLIVRRTSRAPVVEARMSAREQNEDALAIRTTAPARLAPWPEPVEKSLSLQADAAANPAAAPPAAIPLTVSPGPSAPHELRREIHRLLLEHLDMNAIDPARGDDPSLRPRVLAALRRIVRMLEGRLPAELSREGLIGEMADEALGLGPLEHLLADPSVSEVMVVDPHNIYVERAGRLSLSGARFTDEERVRAVIERIITPLGRRVDESSPLVDARLKDGSRVNVVIRPLALRGSCITIRKFARTPITLDKLLELEALSPAMARFLTRSVRAKKNIVIAGGTGSGKTTLLNVLSAAIPEHERVVTIEDAAELSLSQPHVVALESRPSNMEGKGEVPIRALVKNALRMRPDRIVVGECRGGEALDMLQAMNTGHDGSLTTTHANSPAEALMRLETLCLMAGLALPARAIREQIAKSIHLLVQQTRMADGTRKITAIAEMAGIDREGNLRLRHIFEYVRTAGSEGARVDGAFHATGYLPSFLPDLLVQGLIKKGEAYL
jgi:pilus assembly protein CpaF